MKIKTFSFFLYCASASLIFTSYSFAVPINNDTALTAHRGEIIIREQIRFTKKGNDASSANRDIKVIAIPTLLVYGVTEDVNIIAKYPFFYKKLDVDTTGRTSRDNFGLGDLTILGKYRFFTIDRPGETYRADLAGGLKFPTGDTKEKDSIGRLPRTIQVGTGSWDPIAGGVFTWQTLRQEIDIAFQYQFNTEGDNFEFGDSLYHDLSYQLRIWPWEFPKKLKGIPSFLNLVLEANGVWNQKNKSGGAKVGASGGYTLFLSPGIQFVAKRFILETSIQLPVIQQLNGAQPETQYVISGGIRAQF